MMEKQDGQAEARSAPVFGAKAAEAKSAAPWAAAAVIVLLGILAVWSFTRGGQRRRAAQELMPDDGYAQHLAISGLVMSESTSLSGGKSTFIDGRMRNSGSAVVSGVQVQVLFRNDEGMPPRIEEVPLMLIRTHEPYVDTEMVSADPVRPGDEREFRLIFESLPANWNTQLPDIHVVSVAIK